MKLIHRIGIKYIALSIAIGALLSGARLYCFDRISVNVVIQKATIPGMVLYAILLSLIFLSFVLFFRYFREMGTAREAINAIEGARVILWYFLLEAPILITIPYIGLERFTIMKIYFYYRLNLIGVLLLCTGIRNLAHKNFMPIAFIMLGISVFFYVIFTRYTSFFQLF